VRSTTQPCPTRRAKSWPPRTRETFERGPLTVPRTALVTGANQGIGLETCRQLKAAGLDVILTSRDEKAGRAAADALAVGYHRLDVTRPPEIALIAADLRKQGQAVDVLVNNAAVSLDGFDIGVVRRRSPRISSALWR
jgi:NAD(P)-dependent dehydrogenase (short-subunit alcohol dehydrogenase family)